MPLITPSFQRVFNLPEGVSLAYSGNVCLYGDRHLLGGAASLALGCTLDTQLLWERRELAEGADEATAPSSMVPALRSAGTAASDSLASVICKRSEFPSSFYSDSVPEPQNDGGIQA